MSVKIGHAVCDENGKASGGKDGDQTGKEVRISDWYKSTWTNVFRPKSTDAAEMIAKNAEMICKNNNIGYSQTKRLSGYTQALKVKMQLDKINTPCCVDCSSMVALCCIAAGIDTVPTMYTGNEEKLLERTNAFSNLIEPKYLNSSDYLKRGDIILKPGHTVVVLSDGKYAVSSEYYPKYTGTSGSIVDALKSLDIQSDYRYRLKIAMVNRIIGYAGTKKQNLTMLELLKEGKLKRAELND